MMQSSFIERDFNKLIVNVRSVPKERSLLRAFPELAKHREFKVQFEKLNKDNVIRYVVYMYDRNTPFRRKFPDILKRKIEAAKEAGFKISEGGMFEEEVETLLRGKDNKVNDMVCAYARIHKNFKYSFFITMEEIFYSLMRSIVDGDLKNIAELKKTQLELDETMNELLTDDKNPFLIERFLRYIEKERLALRPEDIARKHKIDGSSTTDRKVSGS